jgi:hypothetical protein
MNTNTLPLSGSQFLYERPEALSSEVHSNLRFKNDGAPFRKAEGIHLVPLLVGEFAQAMMDYPIIFAGEEKTPLAVMGLVEGQNFFVKNGRFEDGAYVPAYLRRHPFTVAGAGEELVVCIDRMAGFASDGEGEALFADGEPTAFTKHAMAFLSEFEGERARTQAFIALLTETGLFEVKNTMFVADGRQEPIAEYYAVAEERIAELSDEQIVRLVKRGAMAAVNAHLLSLQRWNALMGRRNAAKSKMQVERNPELEVA